MQEDFCRHFGSIGGVNETFFQTLRNWQGFYSLTGEVAGTLIGLMFIAMSLGNRRLGDGQDGRTSKQMLAKVQTFITPTLIHLASVVIISSILCMPVRRSAWLCLCLGAVGLGGIAYVSVTFRRLRHHDREEGLGAEHWFYHFHLPCLCFAMVLGAAVALRYTCDALFALAASVLLFLSVGVRNSWSATLHTSGLMERGNS